MPISVLLMFLKSKVVPLYDTSLTMPLGEILTQVIFGSGLPDAMQNSCRSWPSSKVVSLLTLVKLARATKDEENKRSDNHRSDNHRCWHFYTCVILTTVLHTSCFWNKSFCYKHLLDEVFLISWIIKVIASIISQTQGLIIPHITENRMQKMVPYRAFRRK